MDRIIVTAVVSAGLLSASENQKTLAGEPLSTSRTITYHAADISTVNAEINFATMIIFDKREKIVVGTCGDADRWKLEHAENVIVIKPEREAKGQKTNVNVIMESGNVYSFLVLEISNQMDGHADLKLFVNTSDAKLLGGIDGRMFVSASEADKYKKEAEEAKAALDKQKVADREKIKDAQNTAPEKIRHDYTFKAKDKVLKQFGVKSMYTLNGFTYIEADPKEAPTVYEVKDGKPSLIEVEFEHGVYIIPKVIDEGYLQIGKSKLGFKREG
jgi:type IV secretory pathway VirB9-like protein